jgi:hypothetical protein
MGCDSILEFNFLCVGHRKEGCDKKKMVNIVHVVHVLQCVHAHGSHGARLSTAGSFAPLRTGLERAFDRMKSELEHLQCVRFAANLLRRVKSFATL